jgi:hypothetical protein
MDLCNAGRVEGAFPVAGPIAHDALRMLVSIGPPVVWVALCPGLLRALLVIAIVGITLALGRLPANAAAVRILAGSG